MAGGRANAKTSKRKNAETKRNPDWSGRRGRGRLRGKMDSMDLMDGMDGSIGGRRLLEARALVAAGERPGVPG